MIYEHSHLWHVMCNGELTPPPTTNRNPLQTGERGGGSKEGQNGGGNGFSKICESIGPPFCHRVHCSSCFYALHQNMPYASSYVSGNEFGNDNDAQSKNNQGIPITEVSIVMKQIDLVTDRIQAVMDIRDTMKQFTLLSSLTKGLPQLSEGQWNNPQSSSKQDDDDTVISEIEAVMDEEYYSAG